MTNSYAPKPGSPEALTAIAKVREQMKRAPTYNERKGLMGSLSVPAKRRCDARRSNRHGSPHCILEAGHTGDHCGHKPSNHQIVWWEKASNVTREVI